MARTPRRSSPLSLEALEDRALMSATLVQEIVPSNPLGSAANLTNVNGTLFFSVNTASAVELWKTDGTAAGTVLLRNFSPDYGPDWAGLHDLTGVNGTLYFVDPTSGTWKSDGTPAGTAAVPAGAIDQLTAFQGKLYYDGLGPKGGPALWKTDGTAAGTVKLQDVQPYLPTVVNGSLFFSGYNGTDHLWKSDGTPAGTMILKDINAAGLTAVQNKLFFEVSDLLSQSGLWVSAGTAAGTVRLSQAVPYSAADMADVNGTLYFFNAGPNVPGIWKSDGTPAGTTLVTPIGTAADRIFWMTSSQGELYYLRQPGVGPSELWKSDGTAAGTVQVTTLPPGGSPAGHLMNVNGTLFFTAADSAGGFELWQSDGTVAGTVLVKDIAHAAGTEQLANVNSVLYFTVSDGQGIQIWKDDPSTSRTTVLNVTAIPASAREGAAFTGTVAKFTDPAGAQPLGTYNAQVDWGDGTAPASAVIVSTPQGFAVSGNHAYAEAGTYTVKVSVAKGGGLPNTVTTTIKVADAPIWAGRAFLRNTEGQAFAGTVATITDGSPLGKAGDFTATIQWGDGQTSTGTVALTGPGKFAVQGGHTYAAAGTYTVTVMATDAGGSTSTAKSTFRVDDAALTAVPPKLWPAATPTIVAAFTDANPLAAASQFVATIDWGDGTTSAGTVARAAGQPFFAVTGTHPYAKSGTYKVTATIRDAGGSSLKTTRTRQAGANGAAAVVAEKGNG